MHSDMSVGDDAKKKPDIISYYNKYKTGVDTMDHMLRRYTSQRRYSRWPMAMPIKRRRKTRKSCSEYERPVCDEHTAHVVKCIECNK
ncbi:unnamed protein product [Euphydryas editha]|nr:unnamed protein product [Euphydryas editha]